MDGVEVGQLFLRQVPAIDVPRRPVDRFRGRGAGDHRTLAPRRIPRSLTTTLRRPRGTTAGPGRTGLLPATGSRGRLAARGRGRLPRATLRSLSAGIARSLRARTLCSLPWGHPTRTLAVADRAGGSGLSRGRRVRTGRRGRLRCGRLTGTRGRLLHGDRGPGSVPGLLVATPRLPLGRRTRRGLSRFVRLVGCAHAFLCLASGEEER